MPTVNGEPGIVLSFAGRPFLAMALEIHDGRIQALRTVVNPRKLRSRHVRTISPTITISATSTAITTVTTVAVELRRRLGVVGERVQHLLEVLVALPLPSSWPACPPWAGAGGPCASSPDDPTARDTRPPR